jgi:hypothetical protein
LSASPGKTGETAAEDIAGQGIENLINGLSGEADGIAVCVKHPGILVDKDHRCIEHVKIFADINAKVRKNSPGTGRTDTMADRVVR